MQRERNAGQPEIWWTLALGAMCVLPVGAHLGEDGLWYAAQAADFPRGEARTAQRGDAHSHRLAVAAQTPGTPKSPRGTPASPPARGKSSAPKKASSRRGVREGAAQGDWSRFRGPSGMGVCETSGLVLQWSPTNNVRWRTALPGPGASSPIVHGDRVYITCYSGYLPSGQPRGQLEQLRRHLIAVRLSDGQVLWDKAIPAAQPEEATIREHGYAASTPVADEERVYVFFGKSGVFALDHQGRPQWQASVGTRTHGWGSAASPVLYQGLVIVNASVESGALVALDRRNGAVRWQAGDIQDSWNTPLVVRAPSGRLELVVARVGRLLAFAPDSGLPLWSCQTEIPSYMVPSVVAADGVVYCVGGRGGGVGALAVRTGGSGDVTGTHRLWTSQKGTNVPSPVYHEGHLYWAHDNLGIVYCAKADTGQIVYEQRLERAGQIYASPLLAEGRLYYLARNGKTFVVAAKPQFELLAVNELDDGSLFNGSPAVAGSRLLVRSDKFLYCLGD